MKKIIISILLVTSVIFAKNNAEININNNTLELSGEYYLDNNSYIMLSFLNTQDKKNRIENERNDQQLISAGFKILNSYIHNDNIKFGLGMKSIWVKNYKDDFTTIPLSFYLKYLITENIELDFNFNYGTNVLTFFDGKKYQETMIKANYKIIDKSYIYLGGRYIETKYDDSSVLTFDDNIFFGYKIIF